MVESVDVRRMALLYIHTHFLVASLCCSKSALSAHSLNTLRHAAYSFSTVQPRLRRFTVSATSYSSMSSLSPG